jgi:hypothetical protein
MTLADNETQALMRLKYHKRSVVIFASRIIPYAKLCGTDTILQDELYQARSAVVKQTECSLKRKWNYTPQLALGFISVIWLPFYIYPF